ncbi:hypothetical protein GUITHDRAFT_175454 [Guillardia theta CCMP2712]|uniref:Uncharacterized protein n=1 Tax=Guillardia theta (strain CCMP2712) TaxID=905079 RepID=L1J3N6_GUITC|nr:hypothetical protein GUITHDRAFT_175454 [Guillardia theta CCMP2712]EKX42739.1 hypothetical protein GUITHDRAFT_175454 [Guillardia theta CCMP2712]|eukprot:XP_005829719.1 hypothetical protein GUITHDRAFT_175454 [Guillardia theta CCMP2712]
MFSLISGLCQSYLEKKQYHLLLLGLDGSGKTSLLERIRFEASKTSSSEKRTEQELQLSLQKISSTVGLNIGRITLKSANVMIWDLGGQEALRGIWDKYYSDAHGLVWVVDASDPSRFEEALQTLEGLLEEPELQDVPLLIFVNKQDKQGAVKLDEIRQKALPQSGTLMHQRQLRIISVSAFQACSGSEETVMDGMNWMIDSLNKQPNFEHRR